MFAPPLSTISGYAPVSYNLFTTSKQTLFLPSNFAETVVWKIQNFEKNFEYFLVNK